MILSFIVFVGLLFSILAVMKRGILLPALIVYAFMPIRTWTDMSVPLPGFGSLTLDPLIALLFSALIGFRLIVAHNTGKEKLSVISIFWVFFGLSVLSAILMGMSGQSSGFKMLVRLIYPILVLLLILRDYRDENHANYIVNLFIGVGVLASLFVLAANVSGLSSWRISAGVDRFSGLGAISDYAYIMALLAVLSYAKMNITKNKLIYGFLTVLFMTQMMMTVTRGAIFSCILAIVAIELFSGTRKLTAKLLMPIILLGLLLSAVTFYEPLHDRVFATHYKDVARDTKSSYSDKFATSFTRSGREGAWSYVAKEVLSDYHILFGFGAGSAEVNIVRDLGGIPHNEYMRILYEMGLIGLTLFVLSFYQIWKAIRRLSNRRFKDKLSANLIEWCCIGIIVLYLSGSLVDNMISKYKNMGAPLYIFVALALIRLKSSDSRIPEAYVSDRFNASKLENKRILNKVDK